MSRPQPDVTQVLTGLAAVVADEASRNPSLYARLAEVLGPQLATPAEPPARRRRRAPGPWDPFAVYAAEGEEGLTQRLAALDLERLRDIVAEHGMNHDGKAMRWRTADRVVGRIVDRVVERAGKGDAFRGA